MVRAPEEDAGQEVILHPAVQVGIEQVSHRHVHLVIGLDEVEHGVDAAGCVDAGIGTAAFWNDRQGLAVIAALADLAVVAARAEIEAVRTPQDDLLRDRPLDLDPESSTWS